MGCNIDYSSSTSDYPDGKKPQQKVHLVDFLATWGQQKGAAETEQ